MVVQKSWTSCLNYWLWSQLSLCGLHCSPVCIDPFIIVFLLRRAVFRGNHVFSDVPYLRGWMFQSCRFRRYQKVIETGSLSPTPNAQCEGRRDFGLSRVCNCQKPRFSSPWVIGASPSPGSDDVPIIQGGCQTLSSSIQGSLILELQWNTLQWYLLKISAVCKQPSLYLIWRPFRIGNFCW